MPSDKIQAQINCFPIMDLWVPGIEEGRGSGVQQKARESRRTQRDRWNQGSNRQGNLNDTRGPITTYSNDLIPSRKECGFFGNSAVYLPRLEGSCWCIS